jgi:uncharacterized protein YraI
VPDFIFVMSERRDVPVVGMQGRTQQGSKRMSIKTKLLMASAALLLSAGAALAVPATAETDLNVRSGPGTQYPVIGSIAGGETVDVGSCTGSWCQVSFGGGTGFASHRYLAMGGAVAPGPAVAVSPYVDDDYYDYGYGYGPSVGIGIYASPGYRYRQGWRGNRGGNWQGRQGWSGNRTGNWQGRQGGGNRMGNVGAGRGAGMNRSGGVAPQISAPAGMRGGASVGGGPRVGAPVGGAGGAIGRGQGAR